MTEVLCGIGFVILLWVGWMIADGLGPNDTDGMVR